MRKHVIIALALSILAGNVFAELGDIRRAFALPWDNAVGAATSSSAVFYIARDSDPDKIIALSHFGRFLSSWDCPHANCNWSLAYSSGGYVWIGAYDNNKVYCCDASDGSLYHSWDAGHDPYGLSPYCFDDGGERTFYIMSYDMSPNELYYHNMDDGSVIYSVPLEDYHASDMAYDWRNNLIWKQSRNMEYFLGMHFLTGSIVASFPTFYPHRATGMAYNLTELYIVFSDVMFVIHCPPLEDYGTNIAPASMGGIKALYK